MMRMLAFVVLVAGCASCAAPPDPELVGEAQAKLMQVPPGIGCVQITVTGATKSVVSSHDVSVGQATDWKLGGLPLGAVQFVGAAFPSACAMVGSTAPSYLSDATPATLAAGVLTPVALQLKQNGAANVSVDFDTGTDGGVASSPDLATGGCTCHACKVGFYCDPTQNCGCFPAY